MAATRFPRPLPLCLLAGCLVSASGPGSPGDPPLRTDREAYRAASTPTAVALTLAATYTNRAERAVYLGRCGRRPPAFELEKWEGGGWRRVYAPVCLQVLSVPVEVRQGEAHTDTVQVRASRAAGGLPRFEAADVAGTYRLVYEAYATPGAGAAGSRPQDLLPLRQRVSNAFRIDEAPL